MKTKVQRDQEAGTKTVYTIGTSLSRKKSMTSEFSLIDLQANSVGGNMKMKVSHVTGILSGLF
jgi:hypothetical protein